MLLLYVWIICFVLPAIRSDSFPESVNYEKWRLLKIGGENVKHYRYEIIFYLENAKNIRIINILKDSFEVGVSPLADLRELIVSLERFHLEIKILHPDIGKLMKYRKRKTKRSLEKDYFDSYMPLEQIERYFNVLENLYPDIIQRRIVGQSYEGRNISLFVLSSKQTNKQNCAVCKVDARQNSTCPSELHTNRMNKRKDLISLGIERARLLQQIQRRNDFLQMRKKRQQSRTQQLTYFRSNLKKRRQIQFLSESNTTHKVLYFSPDLVKNHLNRTGGGVSKKELATSKEKPVIFIDAGAHSREWVSPAATLYFIKKLAETPSMTSHIDWYIMPMVNPDGYKFSWNNDRFWRKSRSKSESSGCYGADLNRNFDHRWGEVDTSRNPCSEHYGGERPSSEKETQIIRDVLYKEKHRLKAYISIHNWGQDILFPYCHSDQKIPNDAAKLENVSKGMVEAIRNATGEIYTAGRGSIMLYPASGTSIDWAHDVLGVTHSYLIELRDKSGLLGFLMPDTFIKPTGEDLFAAMRFLKSEIEKENTPSEE